MAETGNRSSGEVAILLGEEEHFLSPTLRAAKAVNHRFGGFTDAYERLLAYDMAAIVAIVAAGLNLRDPGDIEKLEEKIFRNGLDPLIKPLRAYLAQLANGGRPAKTDGDADPEKKA